MIRRPRVFFVYTHNNRKDRFRNGLKANTELSHWISKALADHFPRVKFLRLQNEKERRIARIRPQDVVIGHFGETFKKAAERTKRLITFAPWSGNGNRSQSGVVNCIGFDEESAYYKKAAAVILLTSEFNQKIYLEKNTNFWHDYFQTLQNQGTPVRVVHQPLDFELFPRIKWAYSTDDFLYIGNTNHMKCVADAQRLIDTTGRTLHLYGTGERSLNHLDAKEVNRLPGLADFFIQPGMWEAQCVSILEAAARGFIPLVTPDTGYPYDHPYLLRHGDFDYNLSQIKKALALHPSERKELADDLHRQFIKDPKHNDWSSLTNVIVDEVKRVISN